MSPGDEGADTSKLGISGVGDVTKDSRRELPREPGASGIKEKCHTKWVTTNDI